MGAVYGPAYELRIVLIDLLRGDSVLADLLFPSETPRLGPDDYRVYESSVELPEALRGVLPRVLIETRSESANDEQDGSFDRGPVTAYFHMFTERNDPDRLELIARRTTQLMGVLGSTPHGGTRIIAAELVKSGQRVGPLREPGFNDANRLTEMYVSRSVGVL